MSHVLFLSHWYPSTTSPILGTFVREHARAVSLFNQVSVIHIEGVLPGPSIESGLSYREKDGDINVTHLRYAKSTVPKMTWVSRISGTLRAFREITQQSSKPDIIHANVYHSADVAVLLGHLYHIPIVITEHSSAYSRNLIPKIQVFKNLFFLNQVQKIMPVSNYLQLGMQQYGIQGKFRVISNTVDTNLFHPPVQNRRSSRRIKYLLAVASLSPVKAIHLLLEAFSVVLRQYPDLFLRIVGDGPEKGRLMNLTEDLELGDKVVFSGEKSKFEVAGNMRDSDLFILTSLFETQGVVLLEAMASGLPVIAPAVGGIPDIINPEAGILTKPGDVMSISQAIETMIENYANYPQDIIRQYAVENFSYPVIGERFNQVYQAVIEEFKKT